MTAALVATDPTLTDRGLRAGDRLKLSVPVTPPTDVSSGNYGTFTATIREDPVWPARVGAATGRPDPETEGWGVKATASGTATGGGSNGTAFTVGFEIDVPVGVGVRRYTLGVTATGGSVGRVSLVQATWLTVVAGGG